MSRGMIIFGVVAMIPIIQSSFIVGVSDENAVGPRSDPSPRDQHLKPQYNSAARPDPNLSPADVVKIQLAALQHNDRENRGIAHCFQFASPKNRQFTGPLSNFVQMLKRPPYDVMLNHPVSLVGKPIVKGNQASLLATLIDKHKRAYAFSFVLSKQNGDKFDDCWMTDGVILLSISRGYRANRLGRVNDHVF